MTKNWKRHEQFKALGQAVSRYNRRYPDGPTCFDPWHEFKGTPSADATLTSRLGNRFAKLHKSSKGPAHNTIQWESTWKRQ